MMRRSRRPVGQTTMVKGRSRQGTGSTRSISQWPWSIAASSSKLSPLTPGAMIIIPTKPSTTKV